jgi:DNA repair photolyase
MRDNGRSENGRVLSLFPLPEAPQKPRGIEALKGGELPSKRDVQYVELGCKTVLNLCNTDRMPDVWTINPYRGCEFACGYCYARYTHEFLGFEGGKDFERTIFVKADAPDVLAATLKPSTLYERPIAVGTATDPYQPAEKRYGITRGILEVLARYPGLSISIVTKSPLIMRDLDILKTIGAASRLTVMVSLATLDQSVLSVFDPRAPSAVERLKIVEALSAEGMHVGIHCAPILPGLTDDERVLVELCKAAREHGARFLGAEVLFLTSTIRTTFWPILSKNFPHLVPLYRRLYSRGVDAPESYRLRLRGIISKHRVSYGLEGRRSEMTRLYQPEPNPASGGQLDLGLAC